MKRMLEPVAEESSLKEINSSLKRIATALERLSPPPERDPDFSLAQTYIWHPEREYFRPVTTPSGVNLGRLVGIDATRDILSKNTYHFALGYPANNVLLWGARGMGKSSLVKAVHENLLRRGYALKLIEISREDLASISNLLRLLRTAEEHRFILFCDDLSFSCDDHNYKSLKAVLDGGVEGRPENVIFYAISNRRHLMPREMIENERQQALNPHETVDEKVSLADRFGLWLGFHPCSQDEYLEMVQRYCVAYNVCTSEEKLCAEAIEWQATRGAHSGRVAWQFFCDLAARNGYKLSVSYD